MSVIPTKKQTSNTGHSSKRQPRVVPNLTKTSMTTTTTSTTSNSVAAVEAPVVPSLLISKTRICIKNIPLKLNNEHDLRQYILQRLSSSPSSNHTTTPITITDCRIRQSSGKTNFNNKGKKGGSSNNKSNSNSNNIAFVGFASSDHAQYAVQQLHRTYYQTTKLHVEMATLPSNNTPKSGNIHHIHPNASTSNMEKNTDAVAAPVIVPTTASIAVTKPTDKKKQAFLAAMGISSESGPGHLEGMDATTTVSSSSSNKQGANRQFWSNDDTDMMATTATTTTNMNNVHSNINDPDSDNENDDTSSDNDESDDVDDADPLSSNKRSMEPPSSSSNAAMDFLRSKQVNVSDLPEEEAEEDSVLRDSNPQASIKHTDENDDALVVVNEQETNAEKGTENGSKAGDNEALIDDDDDDATDTMDPNRLFLRNLPFMITEDELRQHFEPYGTIVECHIAIDDQYRNKGYAFLSYNNAASAYTARMSCDQHDFHGRLLHILPAQKNSRTTSTTTAAAGTTDKSTTYKDGKEDKRRANAMDDSTGWMSTHVRDDAVLDNLAVRLGIRKGDLFNVKDTLRSGDAAVRLALGETAIITENRNYFLQYGIDMETLVSYEPPQSRDGSSSSNNHETSKPAQVQRSTVSILVKNLPFDTTLDDLKQIFIGNDVTILLPPSRTIAVVEYKHPNDAKMAFRKLAYRRFKNVPLYLEWAPLAAKTTTTDDVSSSNDHPEASIPTKMMDGDDEEPVIHGPTATLYVKNLNFATNEDQLRDFFLRYDSNVRTVRIPKKVATVKRDRNHNNNNVATDERNQSMGFGFVEFSSKESAQTVLKKAQGAVLDDHALELRISSSGSNDNSQKPSISTTNTKDNKKLIVRNVPFQATRKELLQLFGSFGTLKKVRLPKKFDGSHRGFAFVEYLTAKESVHAMNTLSKTHLYGRHLVLEWAEKDEVVDDLDFLRSKAERDVMTSAAMAPPRNKKIRFE